MSLSMVLFNNCHAEHVALSRCDGEAVVPPEQSTIPTRTCWNDSKIVWPLGVPRKVKLHPTGVDDPAVLGRPVEDAQPRNVA
jgi:hypothetical protein